MKKSILVLLASFALAACQADREGNVQPTAGTQTATAAAVEESREAAGAIQEGARQAGQDIREGAKQMQESEAGQRIAAGAREAGQGIKQGAGEAAEAAGGALQREGQEAQKEAAATKTQT